MTKVLLSFQRRTFRAYLMVTMMVLSLANGAFAGADPPVIKVLNGSLGQVAIDSQMTVEDAKFFSPPAYLNTPYPLKNIVTVEINESIQTVIQGNFNATVRLRITFVRNNNTTDSLDRDFNISYNSGGTYAQRDVYIFSNCTRVKVRIIQLTDNVAWSPWPLVKVTNQLQSLPDYDFNCTGDAIEEVNDSAWAANTDKDELPVYWAPAVVADEYDLEWTYIDSSALASGRYGDTSNPNPYLIFDNNASRVTIAATIYNIPLLYDNKGHLFYRVRPVQRQPGGGRNEGDWSSDFTPNGLGRFDYNGHERLLNWQATTSYAEEGKRKVVIQYFDGSLRGRQTVTKDNSTNTTIVAENFYDYQGRPVIQVLPAPTMNSIIKYNQGFNVGLNSNIYDKFNYDTLVSPDLYCNTSAAAMDTTSGASQYYSPNNPQVDVGFNKYIPDAKGYPFTEVEYTQDNTGRVSRQSGVGDKFRIGSGHETKYFYSTVDQRELDALFGTEVGDASHYFKTTVRDANGQYSVSYTDMHGRTIATALAGAPDSAKLDTLASYVSATRTEVISTPASVIIKDLVMEHKKSIMVTKAGNFTFTYQLDTSTLKMEGCNPADICYECLYDLRISITDDCNNQKLGGAAFDTLVQNFSIGEIDTSCSQTSGGFSFSFTKWLVPGNYEVTKQLSVSKYGLDYYRDSIFMAANTCKTIDSFMTEQRQILAASMDCKPVCAGCLDSLGTFAQFWLRYKDLTGITGQADTAAYMSAAQTAYNQAIGECNQLCDTATSEFEDIRKMMLMDMTPSSGQYANINNEDDIYSVFYARVDGNNPDTAAPYQRVTTYLNEDGEPDLVYDEGSGMLISPSLLSPEVFAQKFKLSWAEALLQFHPEHCKLIRYESLRDSHKWDRRFAAVDSYAEAVQKGYLNPTNSTDPPFNNYSGSAPNVDPMSTFQGGFFKGQLEDSIASFRSINVIGDVSMWSVACVTVMCPDNNQACFNNFMDPEIAFNPDSMCSGELDMAWRAFRQMYLDIKRNIQNTWINLECADSSLPAAQIMAAGHQPHFSDARELLTANNFTLPTDTTGVRNQYQTQINNFYNQNCIDYATHWWQQLAPCNFIKERDSALIVSRLVQICYEGSDSYHPYGASSVKPGSTNTWQSFEQFLVHYCDSIGIDYDTSCNAMLIPAPKPYEHQVMYGNKPVYSKPDSCECEAIEAYYDKFKASIGYETFGDFMQQVYQTNISDSALNLLLSLCEIGQSSAPECPVLPQPVYLPPAFQCYTADICVGCEKFLTLDAEFQVLFPGVVPALGDTVMTDTTQIRWNQLYEQFMNYRLGFVKTVAEYISFRDTCTSVGNPSCSSDSLSEVLIDYNVYYAERFYDPKYDAAGCDTAHWKVNYSGSEKVPPPGGSSTYDAPVPLSQIFVGGIAQHPKSDWPTTGNVVHTSFEYLDPLCFGDGVKTWHLRIRAHDTSATTPPGLAVISTRFNNNTVSPDRIRIVVFSNKWSVGVNEVYVDYTSTETINFNDWRDIKLKFMGDSLYVYYNEVLQGVRYHGFAGTARQYYFYCGIFNRNPQIDFYKWYGPNNEIMFSDDFDGCNQTVINVPRFKRSTNCSSLFTNFYNDRFGTSYTYNQIDSVYTANGKTLTVCTDGCVPKADCGYQKSYGGSGTETAWDMAKTDCGYIMAGQTNSFGNGALDAYVVKTDQKGNVVWSKTYGGSNDDAFLKIRSTFDGGYIATGYTKSYHQTQPEVFVVKMDAEGDVQWSRGLARGTTFGELAFDVIQTLDSGYVLMGLHNYSGGVSDFEFIRLSSNGTILWSKRIGSNNSEDEAAVYEKGDTLIAIGSFHSAAFGGPHTYFDGMLMKINKANGQLYSTRTFSIGTASSRFSRIYKTSDGYNILAIGSDEWGLVDRRPIVVELNENADVIRVKELSIFAGNIYGTSLYPTTDGGYVVTQGESNNPDVYWHRSNQLGNIISTNRVRRSGSQLINNIVQNADGSFTGAGQDESNMLLMRVTSQLKSTCDDSAANYTATDLSHSVNDTIPQVNDTLTFSNTNISVTGINAPTQTYTYCFSGGCSTPAFTLCGRAEPVFQYTKLDEIDNCSDSAFFIVSKAQELFKVYTDSLKNRFDSAYIAKCMGAYKFEKFTVRHAVSEYHHTLYYYDQAGNLIKTIPPAGVRANYDSLWLDSVYVERLAGQLKRPEHKLPTQYRYNTLDQMVAQKSPDGGLSEFWYDRLGRLSLSRNAKQLAASGSNNHLFSYTKYDSLGRITEVGQIREAAVSSTVNDALTRSGSSLQSWFNSYNNYRHQITQSVYDVTFFTGTYDPLTVYQRNLRNRISYVAYFDTVRTAELYNNAVFYTYDILGNVDTLLNDYGCGILCGISGIYNMMNRNGNRWKKIVYNYDLISGKVNTVAYQRGYNDQFFQRYTYNAENQLVLAESSRDSAVWEREATYEYYKHGPLARAVLGQQQVQGIDYAYTLQGWLKGNNSTGGSATHDMGNDGLVGSANQYTARDAIGLTLNYFAGDYSNIKGTVSPFPGSSAALNTNYRPLFNGNINSMIIYNRRLGDIGAPGGALLLYNYRYDQLNRLTGMDVFKNFDITNNNWTSIQPDTMMKERVSYDASGNILTYIRNAATGPRMDNLQYKYYSNTNQLRQVTDAVLDNAFGNPAFDILFDIDGQTDTSNYVYDAIGNLTLDKKEQINNIKWNVYGKITEITRNSVSGVPVTNIKYIYDALGNRIGKIFDLGGNYRYTWYVRDAQGNVLSTYESNPGGNPALQNLGVTQAEQYLYGSNRLGMHTVSYDVDNSNNGPSSMQFYAGGQFTRGLKQYELTNHLSNVLVVINDKKLGVTSGGSLYDYYNPVMIGANDYYPFGSVARINGQGIPYTRFGFNGKEFDWEAKGWQNQIDYGMRIYDPRIGRFLSVDPLSQSFPWNSPYSYAEDDPVNYTDIDGAERGARATSPVLRVDPKPELSNLYVDKDGVLRNGTQLLSEYPVNSGRYAPQTPMRFLTQDELDKQRCPHCGIYINPDGISATVTNANGQSWQISLLKPVEQKRVITWIDRMIFSLYEERVKQFRIEQWNSSIQAKEIITNDPSSLPDEYLNEVQRRLINGNATAQDKLYQGELKRRKQLYELNDKHNPTKPLGGVDASVFPDNHLQLWENRSYYDEKNDTWWSVEGKGNKAVYHRFIGKGSGSYHWSGSTGENVNRKGHPVKPIPPQAVPKELKRKK